MSNLAPITDDPIVYILFADGEFDQVCEDRETARAERRDLRDMGCTVKMITCVASEQDELIAVYSIKF